MAKNNTNLRSTHERVTGGTAGATGVFKRDDYAKGPVPSGQWGVKYGKTPDKGFSGPNIAKVGGK